MQFSTSRRAVIATTAGIFGGGCLSEEPITGHWPQRGFRSGNTDYNPNASGPEGTPTVHKRRKIPTECSPVIDDNTAYINNVEKSESGYYRVHAIDLRSMEDKWVYRLDSFPVSVTLGTDAVFVVSGSTIHAVGLSGTKKWNLELEGHVGGSPKIAGKTIFCGDDCGLVYAIDATSGNEIWRYDISKDSKAGAAIEVEYSVAVTDETVFVVGDSVHAIDRQTGDRQWRHEPASEIILPPVTNENNLVIAATQTVTMLEPGSGQKRWSQTTPGELVSNVLSGTKPAIAPDGVYVSDSSGTVSKLDLKTGTYMWRNGAFPGFATPPVVVRETVLVGRFLAVDRQTGETRWTRDPSKRVVSTTEPMAVVGDRIYTGDFHFKVWKAKEGLL